MKRHRLALFSAVGALALLPAINHGGPAGHAAAGPSASSPSCAPFTTFEADDFPYRPVIDNPWRPMRPGTKLTLEGTSDSGAGPVPHRVVLAITSLTKTINGVSTVVAWDRDFEEDTLLESELTFFAQDDDGNVWLLGEYPEEFEDGEFVGAPSTWIAGQSGAEAGVNLPARPTVGSPAYVEGKALAVDFFDCGQVISKTAKKLVIDEWAPLEPEGGHQLKTYAKGIGNVKVSAVDDPQNETLVLTKVEQLSAAELAQADRDALKLERRAYRINADYRTTPPARSGHIPPKGY